jgi:hypothetical protein
MGCAVEKPFLQILCLLSKGCEQQMDSRTLCAQQANQAYVCHIYCRRWRACLSWACSIQLRLSAMPVFYVGLTHRFYEVSSSSATITPGALRAHLYEALRTFWTNCSSRIFGWRSLRAPPANSQKHQVLFITRHTPSRLLEWVFNGSHFSCFMFILTLTHSLVCMMHR